ncbi:MAG: hypothetical protein K2O89_01850 [Clostridia bacterium]|nr:hypothetical protein [Clostridia bacterium]
MTVKGFFKSNVFKCLVTLLCVLLVSGIFLTIMNGLLAISDEERFARAISKIYGKSVATTPVAVADYNTNATIEEAYKVEDGNYLVKSTGKGGYENGTVTCWVVVEYKNGAVCGIGKVVIDSNKNQSYIDRVGEKALNQFSELYSSEVNEKGYTEDMITNATVKGTKTAICNAVNGALDYVNNAFGKVRALGERFLEEIQKAYGENVISVYGTDETGAEKLITKEDETVTGFKVDEKHGNATVTEYYKLKYNDGEKDILHYLISSTGNGGYQDGTVTCRVTIAIVGGKPTTIYNAAITGNVGQSYINDIKHMGNYSNVDITADGFEFAPAGDFLTSGATKSSTAIVNAVNGAVSYIKTVKFETSEPEEPEEGEGEDSGNDSDENGEGGNA